jgi:hypothetical protein
MNAILLRDFVTGLGGFTLAFTLAPRLAGALPLARISVAASQPSETRAILRRKSDCGMF